jgi:hypothetical protein
MAIPSTYTRTAIAQVSNVAFTTQNAVRRQPRYDSDPELFRQRLVKHLVNLVIDGLDTR